MYISTRSFKINLFDFWTLLPPPPLGALTTLHIRYNSLYFAALSRLLSDGHVTSSQCVVMETASATCRGVIFLLSALCTLSFEHSYHLQVDLYTRYFLVFSYTKRCFIFFAGALSCWVIHILRNHQGGGWFRNDYAYVIFVLSNAEFDYGKGEGV